MRTFDFHCHPHRFALLSFAVAALIALVPPSAARADDDFKCYSGSTAKGEAKLVPSTAQLADGVETKLTEVQKRSQVCNRASIGSDPIADPVANWTCYALKQANGEAKFVKRDMHVRDRFGAHRYALSKATQLCVTSERDAAGVPGPSDELKCYKVSTAKGAAKFAATDVSITDQLDGTKLTSVKKPVMICDPVDRDGRGTIDPSEHWMCYQIADQKTVPPQPKFSALDVTVENALEGSDARALSVKKPATVCVRAAAHLEGANGVTGPQFCAANHDCSSGLVCSAAGVCAAAGTGAVGDACDSGGDCAAALYCDLSGLPGTCAVPGTHELGVPCTGTGECVAGLVCSSGGACATPRVAAPDYAGVTCASDEGVFRSYFQIPRPGTPLPDFFRLPFPNDARVNADGTLDLSDFPRPGPSLLGVDIIDLYADALAAEFDGFSSTAAVTFRFSKEIDFDTVGANGENIHYVDVTPGTAELGSEHAHTQSHRSDRSLFHCRNAVEIGHAERAPLLPSHTYAVYMTTAIRSAHGETPTQDPDLAALLASAPQADAELTAAWGKYEALRAYLASAAIDPATIAGATVFTVADPTARMRALDAAVEASPLPVLSDLTLCDGVTTSPCDDGGVRACGAPNADYYEIHGRFSVPRFQEGTTPYETPADGGGILFDAAHAPIQQGTSAVCFALTVPKTAPPAGGWPLVVHGHGTGGSFRSFISDGIASTLATASAPAAAFSFDGIAHGERRGASKRDADGLVFNVVNPRAARDNHLQGGVDVMQALRVAATGPLGAGGVLVPLDASKTYYFGHSQGSNVGIVGLAVSDLASAAVLSSPAALRMRLVVQKHLLEPHERALHEHDTDSHPLLTLVQTLVDPGDAINYARLLLHDPPPGRSAKHVYMSWGTNDTYAPTAAISSLALAIGLPVVQPVLVDIGAPTVARPVSNTVAAGDGTSRTAALCQYAPDGPYDGGLVALRNPAAIADWSAFLTSAIATGTPVIP